MQLYWFIEAFIATCAIFVAHEFPLNKKVEKNIIEGKWYGYPIAFAYYLVWMSIATAFSHMVFFKRPSSSTGSQRS